MKNFYSIKYIGLSELLRAFTKMPKGILTAINNGMKEAAFEVEKAGKIRITSGPERAIKTGYLRSSIAVTSVLPFKATVSAKASYGIYVHEGTRNMRARPFLAKGLQDSIPKIESILGAKVKSVIEMK